MLSEDNSNSESNGMISFQKMENRMRRGDRRKGG
jgi:hypothetical protein